MLFLGVYLLKSGFFGHLMCSPCICGFRSEQVSYGVHSGIASPTPALSYRIFCLSNCFLQIRDCIDNEALSLFQWKLFCRDPQSYLRHHSCEKDNASGVDNAKCQCSSNSLRY